MQLVDWLQYLFELHSLWEYMNVMRFICKLFLNWVNKWKHVFFYTSKLNTVQNVLGLIKNLVSHSNDANYWLRWSEWQIHFLIKIIYSKRAYEMVFSAKPLYPKTRWWLHPHLNVQVHQAEYAITFEKPLNITMTFETTTWFSQTFIFLHCKNTNM